MVTQTGQFGGSPAKIALSYALFGVIWIVTTDYLVFAYVEGSAQMTQFQTVKGWVFVAISTILIYWLVFDRQRDLEQTNEQLDTALQQTSILDRILRHNLRNACNVIQANADMLAGHVSGDHERQLEAIETHNEKLIELSEKSKRLRTIVLAESITQGEVDLVERIETQVAKVQSEHPEATVEMDLPETLRTEADSRIDDALYELLENAVTHNDNAEPTIQVAAWESPDGRTAILEIRDDGPGLPEIERKVLEKGFETQMAHSQGLGLWIARTMAVRLGGEVTITDNDGEGTTVRLSLPPSP